MKGATHDIRDDGEKSNKVEYLIADDDKLNKFIYIGDKDEDFVINDVKRKRLGDFEGGERNYLINVYNKFFSYNLDEFQHLGHGANFDASTNLDVNLNNYKFFYVHDL